MSALVHGSPEWHAARQRNIGSSEIAALYDCQAAYSLSHFALWHVKAGLAPAPDVGGPRVRWGNMLEEVIGAAVAEENGWKVKRSSFCTDPTTPGMSCTPDFEIVEGRPDGYPDGHGLLETKNVDWLAHKRSWTNDEPPVPVLLQLQHQLACKGYAWGAVGSLVGGNQLRTYPYLARPALIADIRRRVTAFWDSIDRGQPPHVDGSDGATAVLKSLYPELHDDALDMRDSNEWSEAVAQLIAAGQAKRDCEKVYAEAKNRVTELMQGHLRAWGNGFSVSCSVTPAKADRPALGGEIIRGRAETRTYRAKQMENAE